ncbi:PAB-dependent poly(A)-specific ribonuclease subunit PAN2-like [Acanthaster planci]|uniref:PAN2-PAN3 deadenylation complex catalytic subunit PAN2 n=1 Tax=Acanthaster planci TaxID=133434 RepID=A0A8B7YC60_ACAPL|nr:PAB-dependent poly(A)-specific ribonuclease subunit PAN2-like [Acanthaster planci]XP_022090830.1 PAB-dependent poly(A)-specific ribonuclease subunit PAN2-like [Acanthaster planci]
MEFQPHSGEQYPASEYLEGSIPVEGYVGEDGHTPIVEEYVEGPPLPIHGSYRELHSLMADGADRFGVSAVAFDRQEELFWMGNQGGHMTSYYGPQMQKYTSFQMHPSREIRQITTFDDGVLGLTSDSLHCHARQGLRVFDYRGESLQDMQCMLIYSGTHLLMGGHQTLLVEFDLMEGREVATYTAQDPGVAIMRHGTNFICCGDTSGKVHLRDLRTLKVEHQLDPHSGTLSDFDVHGNQLVTCGYGERNGGLSLDRFLMVYDLRTMRPMNPLHIPIEPWYLRYVPTYSNRVVVVSQTGQFQLLDPGGLVTPEAMLLYQVNIAGDMTLALDVSSNYKAIGFGDSGGYVHQWTDSEEVTFNAFPRETEFAHPPEHHPPISISNEFASYSSIPMPFSEGPLLSDWPQEYCRPVVRQAPPIDPEILRSMKVVQFIGYAPNPGTKKRNQVMYKEVKPEKRKGKGNVPESPLGRDADMHMYMVPKYYRKVEIKYSKLGVDDFDFRHYNQTNFAGLEPHIPNAYCNCMLQLLYFIEPLRCVLESHLCTKEFCLACELGLLFYMLDQSRGQTCQASNFLRAFRTIPEASALGLLLGEAEEAAGKANYPRLIQSWNRFVLAQLVQDTAESETGGGTDAAQQMFEADVKTEVKCRCSKETTRSSSSLLVTLTYPEFLPPTATRPARAVSFASVLQNSMLLDQTMQAWCDDCNRYQPTSQKRTYKRLPDVLSINCHLESNSDIMFWKIQEQLAHAREAEAHKQQLEANLASIKMCRYGQSCTRQGCKFRHMDERDASNPLLQEENKASWLPLGLRMRLNKDGTLEIQEVRDDEKVDSSSGFVDYYLHASIAHIKDVRTAGNLVAHVQVGKTYHKRKEGVSHMQWYIFNDFSIESIEKHEVVQFNMEWKVPCVLFYMREDINSHYDITINTPIDHTVLQPEASLSQGVLSHSTFTPLEVDELPKEGDIVGIDAEFVSLNQEEAEIRSDGTRSTIKPSQMSAARISVIRGQGPLAGQPFIDDYISTQEQVVDYLTKFSGIKPGDLDATISSKHLTTLKATYLKLRYLIDCKVKFVGHGLRKDFRVLNLLVPHKQIIDTAALFNLPKQRILSLRFLAWFFLGMNIQSETHDSIEDARTALQLYRKYLELTEEEEWQKELKRLYSEGRSLQWKVPGTT